MHDILQNLPYIDCQNHHQSQCTVTSIGVNGKHDSLQHRVRKTPANSQD